MKTIFSIDLESALQGQRRSRSEPSLEIKMNSMRAQLLQSCLTLSSPMDYGHSGSSVHEILQARILEGVAMPSSRRSS